MVQLELAEEAVLVPSWLLPVQLSARVSQACANFRLAWTGAGGEAFFGASHTVGEAFFGASHTVGEAFFGASHTVGKAFFGALHTVGDGTPMMIGSGRVWIQARIRWKEWLAICFGKRLEKVVTHDFIVELRCPRWSAAVRRRLAHDLRGTRAERLWADDLRGLAGWYCH